MATSPTYTVNESFLTFQGEGLNMGKRAYFVRLQGCDLSCSFCDSASTWHPDYKPSDLRKHSASELSEIIYKECGHKWTLVVITGGEPALYNLEPLVRRLQHNGYGVALETAGHRTIQDGGLINHICLSPKPASGHLPLAENIYRAHEYKLIVSSPGDIGTGLAAIAGPQRNRPVWLHPEWSQHENTEVLGAIRNAVLADHTGTLRAGYQLHKLYGTDEASGRARAAVPLGGRRLQVL